MSVIVGLAMLAGAAGQSSQWPYRLEWEHDGAAVTHFQLCVDSECRPVDASQRQGSRTWSVAVPILTQGLHTLIVYACNDTACTAGIPPVSVNVTPGPTIGTPGSPAPTPPSTTKAPPRRPPKKTTE
jgi:hypothetical protein